MIYCVRISDIVDDLLERGFREARSDVENHRLFVAAGRLIYIREANVNGHLPEAYVNIAYESAHLVPRKWHVFWCD